LNPWAYPPSQPAQPHYGYFPPPPYIPTREAPLEEAPRYSFDTFGIRTEEEEPHQDFKIGCRSDATRFHYTQQHYDEELAFRQNTTDALALNAHHWGGQCQWNENTTQTLTTIREGIDQTNTTPKDMFSFLQMSK
jgi:hypothetical protein